MGLGRVEVVVVGVDAGLAQPVGLAVAQQAEPKAAPGSVTFFDAKALGKLRSVTVGALPDMLTFTPSGSSVLVAADTVLNEEWWHHRFALRDLAVLTAR